MKADQIRLLYTAGKTPTEIAAELATDRRYVYHVLGEERRSKSIAKLLEEVRRDQKEILALLRVLAGESRHPVDRLRLRAFKTASRNVSSSR